MAIAVLQTRLLYLRFSVSSIVHYNLNIQLMIGCGPAITGLVAIKGPTRHDQQYFSFNFCLRIEMH